MYNTDLFHLDRVSRIRRKPLLFRKNPNETEIPTSRVQRVLAIQNVKPNVCAIFCADKYMLAQVTPSGEPAVD